jgi:DNA-directed RNA polymerase specialized sigma24 family protein
MTARLPETRDTLVAALSSDSPADRTRALDLIARAYRDPVVALVSLRWSLAREDAEDLAQEFFVAAMEKGWFTRYDASRGRFRPFLRSCLDDFAKTAFRDAARIKRGGGASHVALAEDGGLEPSHGAVLSRDLSLLSTPPAAEALFDREWARSVLAIACERLRDECVANGKEVAWRLFERYDLADAPDDSRPTYASLAVEFREPATQVTNHLAWARRRMREHVLATVRMLTGDEREYRDEVRALLP